MSTNIFHEILNRQCPECGACIPFIHCHWEAAQEDFSQVEGTKGFECYQVYHGKSFVGYADQKIFLAICHKRRTQLLGVTQSTGHGI